MKRLTVVILWSLLFLALLLAMDQAFVRIPFKVAGLREVRTFYVDFRARLFRLATQADIPNPPLPAKGWKKVQEKEEEGPGGEKGTAPAPPPLQYVFVDEAGNLQFAASLDEVPARYRKEAKAMAQ